MTGERNENTSSASLWAEARNMMRWLIAVCGGPCGLVAAAFLSREDRRRIVFWLRPLEALVRRLLIVEAARLAPTLRAAQKGGGGQVKRPKPERPAVSPPFCRVVFRNPEESGAWKVRFSALARPAAPPPAAGVPDRLLPKVRDLDSATHTLVAERLALDAALQRERLGLGSVEPGIPRAVAVRPKATGPGNPWPLALRIEALIRVLHNPMPHARRLARRLTRDPDRLRRGCRPPPPGSPGKPQRYGDGPLRTAGEHARRALEPFDTS